MKATPVSIVLDERLFSDTVLRVTRLSSTVVVVCDVRWLNGKNVFDAMAYSERRAKIEALLEMFHSPDLTARNFGAQTHHDAALGCMNRNYSSHCV